MKLYKGLKKISSMFCSIIVGANIAATIIPEVAHADAKAETKVEYSIDNLEKSLPGEFGNTLYSVKIGNENSIQCITYTSVADDTLTSMSVKACNYWKNKEQSNLENEKVENFGDSSVIDELNVLSEENRTSQFWTVIAYVNGCSPDSIGANKVYLIPAKFRDAEALLGYLRELGWTTAYIQKYRVYEVDVRQVSTFGEGTLGDAITRMYCDMYGLDSFDKSLVMEYLKIKFAAGELNTLDPNVSFQSLSNEEKFYFGESIPFLNELVHNAGQNSNVR